MLAMSITASSPKGTAILQLEIISAKVHNNAKYSILYISVSSANEKVTLKLPYTIVFKRNAILHQEHPINIWSCHFDICLSLHMQA